MKIKIDFITNSSSASFMILRKHLSETQILLIKEHIEVAKALDTLDGSDYDDNDIYNKRWYDEWQITDNGTAIQGSTSMDNFSMREFLVNDLGLDEDIIEYHHDG